jgi:diguanylate cyclase (GGDEF)-like protein/PAS domain S-box-containing protein
MAAIRNRPAGTVQPTAALTAVAALACGYTVGSVLHWGSPPSAGEGRAHTLADFMGDFGLSAVAALAAVSCAGRALLARGRLRVSWFLFAASALVAGLGNGVWGWYEIVLQHLPPSPSIADWMFLFFAPFAMAGTLVHQRGPGDPIGWLKLVLDGVMIAGALFSGGWTVALAQEAGSDGGSTLAVALSLAYPVFDILLVSLVLALRFRNGRRDGASMATLVAGYSLIVVSDAIWTVPSVRAQYSSGELLDSGWFLGYLLLAVAPWMSLWTRTGQRHRARHWMHASLVAGLRRALGLLGLLVPYLAGLVCLAGIMVDGLTGDHRVHAALLGAGAAVLIALVSRQAVTLLENHRLTRQLTVREDHFRSLVQGSSDVIMTVDPSGRLGYVSPASLHVFGYEPDILADTSLYRLVHPDDRRAVARAVQRFLAGTAVSAAVECRIRAAQPLPLDGGNALWRHAECTLTRHRGGLVFTCRDVSDRVALQQQLAYNAYHDSLTGLPNRALFAERLEHALSQYAVSQYPASQYPVSQYPEYPGSPNPAPPHPVAVLFLDLDWFKEVNDAGGHAAGDALLTEVAARLRSAVRVGDTVARFGGDEFAALVQCGPDGRAARDVAGRLHEALTRPYLLLGARFVVGASIGLAFWRPGVTATELMREADLAMYEAKAGGKGRVVIFQPASAATATATATAAATAAATAVVASAAHAHDSLSSGLASNGAMSDGSPYPDGSAFPAAYADGAREPAQ